MPASATRCQPSGRIKDDQNKEAAEDISRSDAEGCMTALSRESPQRRNQKKMSTARKM